MSNKDPDWRSGFCIDAQARVVLFVTPHITQLTMADMAALAADKLQCRDAMLFDGGPSVQLFVTRRKEEPIRVSGDKKVPVFLLVAPRSHYK